MKQKIILLLYLLIFPTFAFAFGEAADVWVDKKEVYSDEIVNFYIELPFKKKNEYIDISEFSHHFEVKDFKREVNNKKYDYVIKIVPKKFGLTMTPSLMINNRKTQRIMIKRYNQTSKKSQKDFTESSNSAPDLFVKIEQPNKNIFPNAEGLIKIKLYDGVGIHNGMVDNPTINGVMVNLKGEVETSFDRFRGRGYIVKTWTYGFVLPNSKEHFVNKVKFSGVINGKIIEGTPNFSSPEPFRGVTFGPAREVEIFSEPLKLEIKELEQDIFPAKKVLLSETYEYEKGGFFTNKPIKRNVTATVFGSSPEVVADMVSKDVEGFNVYPSETSKAVEEVDGENAIVIKKTFVYVPIKEGFLKIPDLKYEWYNVDYQQNQETVLLGREIGVSKNPDETGSSQDIVLEKIPSSPMVVNKNPTSVSNVEVINDDKGFINVLGNKYEESKFYRLISIIILFGLMIFYAFKDRLKIKKVRFTKKKKDEGLNEFYRAVSLNDAKLTATSLIAFADKIMPADAPHNLEKVGLLFGGNASLMEEIKKLNQVLYFENNNDWNGANLAILIKKFLKIAKLKSDAKKEKDNKKDDNLPSLYLK